MCRATAALLLVVGSLAAVANCSQHSLFSLQLYNANSYQGHPWWEVLDSEVPPLQHQAALFEAGLQSGNFGGMFVELVAQGKRADAARALAYLINANMTLSGGCPVPPPNGTVFAQQLSAGIASAVEVPADNGTALELPGNVTQADVADAVVAGAVLAAKSCGPPDALSYSRQSQAVASYLNSTCYYVGPLLGPPIRAADGVLNASLAAASDLGNLQDPWGAGAVLTAMQECVAGGEALEQPPPWLPHLLGPIDDGERANSISAQRAAAFVPASAAPAPALQPQATNSPKQAPLWIGAWAPSQEHGALQQTLGGRRHLA